MTSGVAVAWWAIGCGGPAEEELPKFVLTPTPVPEPVLEPSIWDDLPGCTSLTEVVRLPDPVPAACEPLSPGWVSGPVESWMRAKVIAPFPDDKFGYSLAVVDPDGDGRDALVVGAPHFGNPADPYARATEHPEELGGPRTYLLTEMLGETNPRPEEIIALDRNHESIGRSVVSLTARGPLVLGDDWVDLGPGGVVLVDASVTPLETTFIPGDRDDLCGADVGVADLDGSGTPDILTACLQSPLTEQGTLVGFRQGAGWEPFFRIVGTIPYSWFGRPTVGGFDLDDDGVSELAIGEQHVDAQLESVVHLLSGAWEGDCTLDEVGSTTLWNGFPPAQLSTGDLDGDGVGELVVTGQGSAPWGLLPEGFVGQVSVVREVPPGGGQTSELAWLLLQGIDVDESFGAHAAVGDFNADGCADLAVGAPGHIYARDRRPGRVYVFHGPFTGGVVSALEAGVVLEGAHDDDRFGMPLTVGDFDGDGIDDLAVSAQNDASGGDQAGAVYVLAGVTGAR